MWRWRDCPDATANYSAYRWLYRNLDLYLHYCSHSTAITHYCDTPYTHFDTNGGFRNVRAGLRAALDVSASCLANSHIHAADSHRIYTNIYSRRHPDIDTYNSCYRSTGDC